MPTVPTVEPVTDLSTAINAAASVVGKRFDQIAAQRDADKAEAAAADAAKKQAAAQAKLQSSFSSMGTVPGWFWAVLAVSGVTLGATLFIRHIRSSKRR